MRRSAAFTVFSLMGREPLRSDGNTYLPRPVTDCNSRNSSSACLANGTMCCSPIFIFSAGMRHWGSVLSRSNSVHSA